MDSTHSQLSPGTQIGDYHLLELLYDGTPISSWRAQQISIGREVIIDSLDTTEDTSLVPDFLDDVKAKASVDHPLIGSVFEAVEAEHTCFYAREKINGTPLSDIAASATPMHPEQVVHVIKQIAEANIYLEEQQLDSLPIQTDQIYLTEQGHCRLVNMAVNGKRNYHVATQDKHTLATALLPLLEKDQPGSTRTRSLLDYMADIERETPLSWEQVRELSEEIEAHLSESQEQAPSLNASTRRLEKSRSGKKIALFLGIGACAVAAYFFITHQLNKPEIPKKRDLSQMVGIPAGNYPAHHGEPVEVASFWIDSHEVTIAEYAEFLKNLGLLSSEQITIYQHPEQPVTKTNNLPDNWENLYAAAQTGSTWNSLTVGPNPPVVGIDWWDAYTYCKFNRRRLPTQAEWDAALHHSLGESDVILRSEWGPVDQGKGDLTDNGIHGLAGNVSEWTAQLERDPAFPTKKAMPLVIGGSYQKKSTNATFREWLNAKQLQLDDARSLRRQDLGFRTVSENQPSN